MKKTCAVLFMVLTASSVAADDSFFTKKYALCMDESGGVTASMLDCIGEETMTQDARLNGAYKKLGSQLAQDRKKQLVAAQRLWIQYRVANCRFYADPDGGTMATVTSSDCVLQATATRAKELEQFIQ